jgi:predicted RNase H-like nuclease (RuvC/YqgF family)
MPEEQQLDYTSSLLSEFNTKLRDMEEKQKLLKERVLLIGQNLIESKEKLESDVAELKFGMEEAKRELEKIKSTIIRLVEELEKKARKNEVEILAKQMKMFDPLIKNDS